MRASTLAAWISGALLTAAFASAMGSALEAPGLRDLAPLGASGATLVGGILFLLPRAGRSRHPLTAVAVAACLGGGIDLAVSYWSSAPAPPATTSLGTGLLLYLAGTSVLLVAPDPGGRPAAACWVLFLAGLVAVSPVWLGPVIDRTEPAQWITDALLAVNPLTHLGTLAGIDYLRSDWFYRHSPFGGLRYDYPSPATVLVGLLLAGALASLAAGRGRTPIRRRRESAPTAAAAS
jgi:hypothetical protein